MADATAFFRTTISVVNTYIKSLEDLNQIQDRMAQDPTLAAAAAAAASAMGRTDLVAADFANLGTAIQQFVFTYNSGTPTQKSYLYKML